LVLTAAKSNATSPVLEGGTQFAPIYNKYVGEILAPISVVNGWLATGNRESSEKVLLPGSSYGQCKIRFFQSTTNALVDSEVVAPNGSSVGISSKAGPGAAASVTSLFAILNKIQLTNSVAYEWLLANHQYPISIIQTINDNSSIMGVLEAAKIMNLISQKDLEQLMGMKTQPSEKLSAAISQNKSNVISPALLDLSKLMWGKTPGNVRDVPPSYHPFYHILAGIAKRVAANINRNNDFDAAVRAILNHSSVIQVNSKIGRLNKTDAQFKEFRVVYPPNFNGKIYANASKNFFTTGVKGKLSFKIKAKLQ